jgi:uncharacterized membrane protein HdeD (DUF308 family)
MENQIQAFIRKTNKATLISLVSGIIAIAPYLILIFGYLLAFLGTLGDDILSTLGSDFVKEITGLIFFVIISGLFLPSLIFGLSFGLISLTTGGIAIIQTMKSQGTAADYRLVIVSILLGVLGIIANIMFLHYSIRGFLISSS